MEFDKSRVYTALNADELKVGSKVIVADSLDALKQEVRIAPASREDYIVEILPEETTHRFQVKGENVYSLAYLISPPKEPEYQPFSDTETAFKIITAHGGWVKNEKGEYLYITSIDVANKEYQILINGAWEAAQFACETCVFADDGTPVGEKVEDDNDE